MCENSVILAQIFKERKMRNSESLDLKFAGFESKNSESMDSKSVVKKCKNWSRFHECKIFF